MHIIQCEKKNSSWGDYCSRTASMDGSGKKSVDRNSSLSLGNLATDIKPNIQFP